MEIAVDDMPDIELSINSLREFITPYVDEATNDLVGKEQPEGVDTAYGIVSFVSTMQAYDAKIDWDYLVYCWACIQHDVDAVHGDEPTEAQLDETRASIKDLVTLAQGTSAQKV